jgi:hypothetical protein
VKAAREALELEPGLPDRRLGVPRRPALARDRAQGPVAGIEADQRRCGNALGERAVSAEQP